MPLACRPLFTALRSVLVTTEPNAPPPTVTSRRRSARSRLRRSSVALSIAKVLFFFSSSPVLSCPLFASHLSVASFVSFLLFSFVASFCLFSSYLLSSGAWTEFSKCVPTDCGCPAGKQQRQFHVEVEAQFGGKKCAAKHLSVHERDCQADEKDIKRCPNALLDAPCEDLTEIVGEAKALRCKVSAILEALQKHEKK